MRGFWNHNASQSNGDTEHKKAGSFVQVAQNAFHCLFIWLLAGKVKGETVFAAGHTQRVDYSADILEKIPPGAWTASSI